MSFSLSIHLLEILVTFKGIDSQMNLLYEKFGLPSRAFRKKDVDKCVDNGFALLDCFGLGGSWPLY